ACWRAGHQSVGWHATTHSHHDAGHSGHFLCSDRLRSGTLRSDPGPVRLHYLVADADGHFIDAGDYPVKDPVAFAGPGLRARLATGVDPQSPVVSSCWAACG